ncbi:phage head closure protein [Comamonas thiooxydans]|uniref:phage head closure protein n=1 Tax=Comamonas thiooxydans TaxID=363952 RepID=UPI0020CDFB3D|nr:phage head closure protein [Comamonas thiooxydans]BDR08241.1 phage head closure protein [Comamonas thiooxydans]
MDAGSLRDRIHIQRRLPGGGLGQLSNNWEEVAKAWANIRFASGSETVRAGQVASKAQASIRIRWRTDIKADMRVVCAGVEYSIKAVLPERQRREYVDLVCEVTNG